MPQQRKLLNQSIRSLGRLCSKAQLLCAGTCSQHGHVKDGLVREPEKSRSNLDIRGKLRWEVELTEMAGPESGGSWWIQSLRGLWQVTGRESWRKELELTEKPALLVTNW